MTFLAGPGTGLAKDYTVFATTDGHVKFEHARRDKKRIRVEAVEAAPKTATAGGNA
jgi:ribosomal protein L27